MKYQVILVSPDSEGEDPIELSERDREMGVEIEKYLVQEVVRRHQLFLLQVSVCSIIYFKLFIGRWMEELRPLRILPRQIKQKNTIS